MKSSQMLSFDYREKFIDVKISNFRHGNASELEEREDLDSDSTKEDHDRAKSVVEIKQDMLDMFKGMGCSVVRKVHQTPQMRRSVCETPQAKPLVLGELSPRSDYKSFLQRKRIKKLHIIQQSCRADSKLVHHSKDLIESYPEAYTPLTMFDKKSKQKLSKESTSGKVQVERDQASHESFRGYREDVSEASERSRTTFLSKARPSMQRRRVSSR